MNGEHLIALASDECGWEVIGEPLYELSPRQYAIARLAARGYNNERTAKELGISTGTVKTYKSRLYTALGLENGVVQLAAFYLSRKFVEGQHAKRLGARLEPELKKAEIIRSHSILPIGNIERRGDRRSPSVKAVDEKWERIFNEKFADPTYYTRPSVVRISSTLADV